MCFSDFYFCLKYGLLVKCGTQDEFETDPDGEQKGLGHQPCCSEGKMLFFPVQPVI